jgi:hypothetical protein
MTGFNFHLRSSPHSRRGSREGGRKHERTEFPVLVRIISYAHENQCYEGVCIDISETGVAFLTEAELDMHDLLEIAYQRDGQTQCSNYVRLIYRSGPRYGAYFTRTD